MYTIAQGETISAEEDSSVSPSPGLFGAMHTERTALVRDAILCSSQ